MHNVISVRVGELTPEILTKSEHWRFTQKHKYSSEHMSETLPVSRIQVDTSLKGWNRVFRLQMETEDDWVYYDSDVTCFPVSISSDGIETALSCPKMPEETKIEWQWFGENKHALVQVFEHGIGWWVAQASDGGISIKEKAPTPLHYPRLTCDSGYVWSQRKSIT